MVEVRNVEVGKIYRELRTSERWPVVKLSPARSIRMPTSGALLVTLMLSTLAAAFAAVIFCLQILWEVPWMR